VLGSAGSMVRRRRGVRGSKVGMLVGAMLLPAGCGLLADKPLPGSTPAQLQHITFEIVAKDNRCQPSVLAADREGRSILITFHVTSVGKSHRFLIPDLDVRTTIPAGTAVAIPVVADRGGIFRYACTSSRWITPLTAKGKLAIK
jgi:hypothetical protein